LSATGLLARPLHRSRSARRNRLAGARLCTGKDGFSAGQVIGRGKRQRQQDREHHHAVHCATQKAISAITTGDVSGRIFHYAGDDPAACRMEHKPGWMSATRRGEQARAHETPLLNSPRSYKRLPRASGVLILAPVSSCDVRRFHSGLPWSQAALQLSDSAETLTRFLVPLQAGARGLRAKGDSSSPLYAWACRSQRVDRMRAATVLFPSHGPKL